MCMVFRHATRSRFPVFHVPSRFTQCCVTKSGDYEQAAARTRQGVVMKVQPFAWLAAWVTLAIAPTAHAHLPVIDAATFCVEGAPAILWTVRTTLPLHDE